MKKKLKQKNFAASIDRQDIQEALKELTLTLDEHIQFVIDSLKEKAVELGLQGDFKID